MKISTLSSYRNMLATCDLVLFKSLSVVYLLHARKYLLIYVVSLIQRGLARNTLLVLLYSMSCTCGETDLT